MLSLKLCCEINDVDLIQYYISFVNKLLLKNCSHIYFIEKANTNNGKRRNVTTSNSLICKIRLIVFLANPI